MKKFDVTIRGIAPLLQAYHPTPEQETALLKREKGKKKQKDLTDQEAFDMHSYKTSNEKFYQPSEMIESAMVRAAVNFKLEGKKTYKDIIKAGILIEPLEIIHKNQTPSMDARWGRNQNTKGAVWVVRPRFDEWELEFTITLLQDERVDESILKQILEYAGAYVGIGAWRPKYGRFEVLKFKAAK